ncbi:hypothetical protein THAOC_14522 [Thalassiosira oceanica]|uniref:Tail specific protease domain-containing protein n=2 Tax=Thalassiosira oceanica TaxID=159749 RepID=K0SF55_THAOC|nr:hypothetical protein THAOC_14522 [Thalassiosira oceanica]|eukprot:EJK64713.1 hypothetical protein THAOC_14522 [Thalassiosira oceanica]
MKLSILLAASSSSGVLVRASPTRRRTTTTSGLHLSRGTHRIYQPDNAESEDLEAADPYMGLLGNRGLQQQAMSMVATEPAATSYGGMSFNACEFSSVVGFNMPTWSDSFQLAAPPSEVSSCIKTFPLEIEPITEHIQSLMNSTRDFYIFKDVAIDPAASIPNDTMLDYPIYEGPEHGQVDVFQEMTDLLARVTADGATLDTFWEINEIYGKLLDAHINIQFTDTGSMLDNSTVFLAAGEVISGALQDYKLEIDFPSNEFTINAVITDNEGAETTTAVTSIDGQKPLDFFTKRCSTPPFDAPLKSIGPRIQNLLQKWVSGTEGTAVFGLLSSGLWDGAPNMARFLKDEYQIKHADGTAITWKSFQPISSNTTREEIQSSIDEPGALYSQFEQALTDLQIVASSRKRKRQSDPFSRKLQTSDFTMVGDHVGFVVRDDYAVFKIDTFEWPDEDNMSGKDFEEIWQGWNDLTNSAADAGVTRLIVDIIGNGGGSVDLGYALASFMYPDAQNEVQPFFTSGLSDALGGTYSNATMLANEDPTMLVSKLNKTVGYLGALAEVNGDSSISSAYETTKLILTSVQLRDPISISVEEMTLLLNNITGLADGSSHVFTLPGSSTPVPVELQRGGVTANYTSQFVLLQPNAFNSSHIRNMEMEHPYQFNQYIVLADGNDVGSTANTFMTTVNEYSKSNPDPNLRLVSYGGSGKREDSAVSQFSGGFIGSADLSTLYVPDFLLLILASWFDGTPAGGKVNEISVAYDATIPDPSYYNFKAPGFPVSEIYSALTGQNSIPLEYVDQVPDNYIRQWPTSTSFSSPADLPGLYDLAAESFDDQTMDIGEGEQPSDPANEASPSGSSDTPGASPASTPKPSSSTALNNLSLLHVQAATGIWVLRWKPLNGVERPPILPGVG